jgi:hypothetical protein
LLRAEPPQLTLSNTGPDRIPRKPFGRTGETVSVIGVGGYSLGDAPSLNEAIAIVHATTWTCGRSTSASTTTTRSGTSPRAA